MPDEPAVRDEVLTELSKASGTPKTDLADGNTLQRDLGIKPENFTILAQNLRAFIKASNPQQTLLLKEINTASATVGSVIALVLKRANP
jgi:hypothetical protein